MTQDPLHSDGDGPSGCRILLPLALLLLVTFGLISAYLIWRVLRPGEPVNRVPPATPPRTFVRAGTSFPGDLRFVDITDAAGIRFRHVSGARGRKLLPETMGGGCAFLDFDGDGDQDLLLVNSCHWPGDPTPGPPPTPALHENDGRGNFTDVTVEAGLAVTFYGMGVAVGDYDGDGRDDLFLTAVGGDRLFRNIEGRRFVETTGEAGIPEERPADPENDPSPWSTSAAFLDYDLDGWLDLFVCRYITWSPALDLAQGFQITGLGRAYGPPTHFAGAHSRLYRNRGGHFEDVSRAAGVEVPNPHTGAAMGKALGVAVADVNRDGYPDVLVANDTVQNFLLVNQRDGTFQEVGVISGVAFDEDGKTRGAMGIDWAEIDSRGTQAIVIGNFANEITALYRCEDPSLPLFTDDAVAAGIGNPSRRYMKFGVFFFDVDLDGRLDIFEANGHLESDIATVQAEQTHEQPAQLFWNAGPGAPRDFEEIRADRVGADLFRPLVGRGCASGDIDGDGDLDVVVVSNNGRARLFRNDRAGGDGSEAPGWIRLHLRGKAPNTNALGARVEAVVAGETLYRSLTSGRSYLSQCEQVITLGLGSAPSAEVRIHWPGVVTPQELGRIPRGTSRRVEQP